MKYLNLAGCGLLIAAGFWLGRVPVAAGEPSKVIYDDNWTIEIRPANRSSQSTVIRAGHDDAGPAPESVAAPQPQKADDEPKPIGPELPPFMAPPPSAGHPVPRMTYADAYAAVPFSRTEYEANPGFRHQAAMELMFGTLRPTTVVQNYTPRASRYPDFYQLPYGRSDTQHINIRSFGGGYNYNGYSPFGYPFGVRGAW